jgi:hypothetical protein
MKIERGVLNLPKLDSTDCPFPTVLSNLDSFIRCFPPSLLRYSTLTH